MHLLFLDFCRITMYTSEEFNILCVVVKSYGVVFQLLVVMLQKLIKNFTNLHLKICFQRLEF